MATKSFRLDDGSTLVLGNDMGWRIVRRISAAEAADILHGLSPPSQRDEQRLHGDLRRDQTTTPPQSQARPLRLVQ